MSFLKVVGWGLRQKNTSKYLFKVDYWEAIDTQVVLDPGHLPEPKFASFTATPKSGHSEAIKALAVLLYSFGQASFPWLRKELARQVAGICWGFAQKRGRSF
jgi:hypothetical protein